MKKATIFLLYILIYACQPGPENTPKPELSEEKMVAIMIDLAISDAMIEHELLPTNQLIYQKKLSFYEDVFERHGTSTEKFVQSFEMYSLDLKQMDAMYDRVMEELSEKEIELKSDI